MSLNDHIGLQIKKARKLARLTQKELGERLGKSGATIAYLEQGKRRVSPDILEGIARETSQPLSYFFVESTASGNAELRQRLQDLQVQLSELAQALSGVQQQLDDSDQLFKSVFEQAEDAMILLLPNGMVLDANPAFLQVIGMKRQDYVGKIFWEIGRGKAAEQEIALYRQAFLQSLEKGVPLQRVRYQITNINGETIPVDIRSQFLTRGNNELWAMLGIVRPIQAVPELVDALSSPD